MSLFDTDTDLISKRDPKQIRGRRFARVRKGYDPDQVRDFLDEVATWMEQLESELQTAQDEAEAISRRPGPDPYEQVGSHFAELIRGAEEHAVRVQREAEEESGRQLAAAQQKAAAMRSEAEAQAARIRTEAEEGADRITRQAHEEGTQLRAEAHAALERARAEAEATLAGLGEERDRLLADIGGARMQLSAALTRLDGFLQEQEGKPESSVPAPALPSSVDLTEAAGESDAQDADAIEIIDVGSSESAPEDEAASERPARERTASLLGLEADPEGPEDPFEWPDLPPDPWEFTADLDRQLFGGIEQGDAVQGSTPPPASLFDEQTDFDPKDIDIQLPDIPLIDDHRNNDKGPSGG